MEDCLRRTPAAEHSGATPVMRDETEDIKVGERVTGRLGNFLGEAEPSLRIDEGAILLAPTGSRQKQMRGLGGFGGGEHVLNHEEIELSKKFLHVGLVDPRMQRVCSNDPKALNLSVANAFDDLVVSPTVFVRNPCRREMQNMCDFFTMGGIREVTTAKQIGGIAVEA